MKLGDFTMLAQEYHNRPGYSENVLNVIRNHICAVLHKDTLTVTDVGAGTGKLTENLINIGLHGFAVEPNDAMRTEGMRLFQGKSAFVWMKGAAERVPLSDQSTDWITMGSAFHWTDTELALKEFHRILRPNGFFTAVWNPRDIESSPLHKRIEQKIYEMVPNLNRVSSGSRTHMKDMDSKLLSTPFFQNLFLIEAKHEIIMTKERYLGAWRSVNDIHSQAGDELFGEILKMIANEIAAFETITVPYITRAFTVQSVEV